MANEKQSDLSEKPKELTPELVIKLLKEGHTVSITEAEEVLKFMRKIANIAVSHYLNSNTPNTNPNK